MSFTNPGGFALHNIALVNNLIPEGTDGVQFIHTPMGYILSPSQRTKNVVPPTSLTKVSVQGRNFDDDIFEMIFQQLKQKGIKLEVFMLNDCRTILPFKFFIARKFEAFSGNLRELLIKWIPLLKKDINLLKKFIRTSNLKKFELVKDEGEQNLDLGLILATKGMELTRFAWLSSQPEASLLMYKVLMESPTARYVLAGTGFDCSSMIKLKLFVNLHRKSLKKDLKNHRFPQQYEYVKKMILSSDSNFMPEI